LLFSNGIFSIITIPPIAFHGSSYEKRFGLRTASSSQLTVVIFSAILYIRAYTGQFSDELHKFKNEVIKFRISGQ